MDQKQPLIKIEDYTLEFETETGTKQVINDLNLTIYPGESLGLVGEAGAGKTTAALSILRLLDKNAKLKGGKITYKGKDMASFSEKEMENLRGGEIAMIFQNPLTSLNPVFTVGEQIAMVYRKHKKLNNKQAWEEAGKLVEVVGIPRVRLKDYPHQFSGGMRQRIGIAASLVCEPELLIADEPTTALDVTIQSQIVDLLLDLRQKLGTAILIITHDMGVVADIADQVAVMYAGVVVEQGSVRDLFYHPRHPYTWGLLDSIPKLDHSDEPLIPIQGTPPDLLNPPKGCPFAARCSYCMAVCHDHLPEETETGEGHTVRCWLQHEFAPHVNNHFEREDK